MNNKRKPIHPIVGTPASDYYAKSEDALIGLTKREYFAAMAMQGMIMMADGMADIDFVVKKSIQCADELLKQLEQ